MRRSRKPVWGQLHRGFESHSLRHVLKTPPRTDRRISFPPSVRRGELPEWTIGHDWKSCVPARVPWVRIPHSPPSIIPLPPSFVSIVPVFVAVSASIRSSSCHIFPVVSRSKCGNRRGNNLLQRGCYGTVRDRCPVSHLPTCFGSTPRASANAFHDRPLATFSAVRCFAKSSGNTPVLNFPYPSPKK